MPHDRHLVQVGLDQLAGVLDEAVHEAGLDARVEAAPVGQGEEAEDHAFPCIVMVGFNNGNHYRADYYSPESLLVISLSLRST